MGCRFCGVDGLPADSDICCQCYSILGRDERKLSILKEIRAYERLLSERGNELPEYTKIMTNKILRELNEDLDLSSSL